jgi:hypothetical protein
MMRRPDRRATLEISGDRVASLSYTLARREGVLLDMLGGERQ